MSLSLAPSDSPATPAPALDCAAGTSVAAAARAVLMCGDPRAKAAAARAANEHVARLAADAAEDVWTGDEPPPPDTPARPERPRLAAPRAMPKRRLANRAGRIALLHAVAHIELNAIDLACDIVARFVGDPALAGHRTAFATDWLGVAADEARHFLMIVDRLAAYGATYGDLPAHDGLWAAARATRHDLAARLAVAPLVFEARGLDVTPAMISRLRAAGDAASAAALEVIYTEEVGHVAVGARWFRHVCRAHGADPESVWTEYVRAHAPGVVKPPFNVEARAAAGLPQAWYAGVARTDPGRSKDERGPNG